MRKVLKRVIKLSISAIYFAVQSVANVIAHLTGKAVRGSAVILYYHGIRPEYRVRFARQMDTLVRWTKPVAISFRSSLRAGDRFAAVTFDDGFASFVETA